MQSYSVITEISTLFLEQKIKSEFNSKHNDKKKGQDISAQKFVAFNLFSTLICLSYQV